MFLKHTRGRVRLFLVRIPELDDDCNSDKRYDICITNFITGAKTTRMKFDT